MIVQSVNDDVTNLKAALKTTKVIDWKVGVILPFTQFDMIELVRSILPEIGMDEVFITPSATFILDTKEIYQDVK